MHILNYLLHRSNIQLMNIKTHLLLKKNLIKYFKAKIHINTASRNLNLFNIQTVLFKKHVNAVYKKE